MKNHISFLFLFSLVVLSTEKSYSQESMMASVKQMISQGNGKGLGVFFKDFVDLRILDKEKSNYSKEKATVILNNFFIKYPCSGFNYMHQGKSKEGNKQYTIGTYQYNQKRFKVYILMEREAEKYIIKLMDFEEEGE